MTFCIKVSFFLIVFSFEEENTIYTRCTAHILVHRQWRFTITKQAYV